MVKNTGASGGRAKRPQRSRGGRPGRKSARSRPRTTAGARQVGARPAIVERHASASPAAAAPDDSAVMPFRVLIAVHRPRFRGRAVRAAALVGWEVTALLNKQDVVGQVARP